MRRAGLIALFALGAGVLVAALIWILRLGARMESAELEARRHAAQEERARLALWRMDSALSTFLAAENAQPVAAPAGSRTIDPPFVRERFEVGGGHADRDRLLALLGQPALAEPALPQPEPAPPGPSRATPRPASHPTIPTPSATAAAPTVEPSTAEPKAIELAAKKAGPAHKEPVPAVPSKRDSIVERESANQSQLNTVEFENRLKFAGLQSQYVQEASPEPSATENPPAQGAEVQRDPPSDIGDDSAISSSEPGRTGAVGGAAVEPEAGNGASGVSGTREAVSPDPATELPVDRGPAAPPPSRPPSRLRRPAGPRGPTGIVRPFAPVWADDGRLLLVRRVVRDGTESLQGLDLDPAATRAWLLDGVRDLLPAGDLEPVGPAEAADPGRRLALLPWRLVPGPPPEVDPGSGPASVRLGLALATSAILAVGLAAAFALVAGLRLARRRTEFASAVIHELRTPLTTFQLYTDMLAEGMVPPAEEPRYLGTLRREAGRLGHLVENVLAFARLERRRAPEARRVALVPALTELAGRLRERAEAEGFTLHFEAAAEVQGVEVAVDPTAVERILHNLLDNSIKYGRSEGAAEAASRLDLAVAVPGRTAVVHWRDRGPGIPRRVRRHLFKPFQRGNATGGEGAATPTRAGEGIGLGLALSRQLARRFGGDLRFVEPDGPGAAFELTLPAVSRRPPASASSTATDRR